MSMGLLHLLYHHCIDRSSSLLRRLLRLVSKQGLRM